MNDLSFIPLEIMIGVLGLGLLLLDLWWPSERRKQLGYVALAGVVTAFLFSLQWQPDPGARPFGGMIVLDPLALFFKRFFLAAAALVLLLAIEFSDRIQTGLSEYFSLTVFALLGMLFAASANDFIMVFVSLELITIAFYILTSFQRAKLVSLEAGVKYLILGALSTAFTVYGIALIFGTAGTTNFTEVARAFPALAAKPVFALGVLLVIAGLGFKIAAFPFQIWAPDVYQGAPAPTVAFLAVGSKAAGIVLLLRVLFTAVPDLARGWTGLLMLVSAVTILYGNLCAIPQRNIKRLLGYSSIAQAGYLLLGFAAFSASGSSSVLFYLVGYLFAVLAALTVVVVVSNAVGAEDSSAFSGLARRSPFLAMALSASMISLAGIPPLAGFFGKFLLLRAVVEQAGAHAAYYWLAGLALVGVVVSFYYYLNVVRMAYWGEHPTGDGPIAVTPGARMLLVGCLIGMIYLGLLPDGMLRQTDGAAAALNTNRPADLVLLP